MMHQLKNKIRQRLVSGYSRFFSSTAVDAQELKSAIASILNDFVRRDRLEISDNEKLKITEELTDELIGYGPLEPLLKDPQVSEIMINGAHKVYVERNGETKCVDIVFDDDDQLMYFVYKILAPTRRRVDESFPYTDVSLKDGSRVNIIIPPLALNGPVVTIRKFSKEIATIDDLVAMGTLDKRMGELLVASIRGKVNIVFAGPTGAGKTTTLNVLSACIPDDERIVTIEDTAELHLLQEHVVRLEARQPNIEGKGEVSIRELFKNTLRMRPDRIILGEIRGAEALDMLQAICSGHAGSLSVIHANSPEDVIYRLETMILASGIPLTLEAIHRQIATSVNLIVQQEQLLGGARKITYITQVNGLKDGQIVMEDIFRYELEGIDAEGKVQGKWAATGVIPAFYPLLKKLDIDLPVEIFNRG